MCMVWIHLNGIHFCFSDFNGIIASNRRIFIVFNCFNGVYYVYILRHRFNKRDFVMGFWLSILGMLTFCLFPDAMNIVFAFIGGGSLLLTGMILKRKGQGNE